MIALRFHSTKEVMNQLLAKDLFDHFLLAQAVIRTNVTYEIDGHYNDGFYPEEARSEHLEEGSFYLPFSELKKTCYELIKGAYTPGGFTFSFLLSPQNQRRTVERAGSSFADEDVTGMYINLRFKDGVLTATTGISYKSFSLDHSLDEAWDRFVCRFFDQHGLAYELL